MSLSWIFHPITLVGFALGLLTPAVQADAIYADFVTSKGNFTCQLDYTNAPKAVANFIGLATGQRAWLDETTGLVRTNNFYTNVTFHRVIDKFMIQGGSPNGLGTDGPGYAFKDEFSPLLRHDTPGVLSMANSGPDSNGSQFFVTVTNTYWLDGRHTVFGRVTSGMNVVYAISQVATNTSSKPLTNVVMQQVTIRRVGPAADAFNIHDQGLPVVTNLPLQIAKSPGQVTLTFSNRLSVENRLYSSTNLSQWSVSTQRIETAASLAQTMPRGIDSPYRYYKMAQTQYATPLFTPINVLNQKLALTFISGKSGTNTINFDAVGSGTYTFPPGAPGLVYGYYWTQKLYSGEMGIELSGQDIWILTLKFTSYGAGTFSGTDYPYYPYDFASYALSGTFTLSAP